MISLGHAEIEDVNIWGKVIGGMAGLAMGGPVGAVVGAALGHAADSGAFMPRMGAAGGPGMLGGAKVAAMLGQRDQLFAISVVALAAKLAKCDGPVVRAEIEAFKSCFRIPKESTRDVGRMFDIARDSAEAYHDYAKQLGTAFANNRGMLEDVLSALFIIARADGPVNGREEEFLLVCCHCFKLGSESWERARDSTPRRYVRADEEDPYKVLGVPRTMQDDEVRAAWRKLMWENHPDSLASRGVPQEFIDRASDRVARINAAWDTIKRERGI